MSQSITTNELSAGTLKTPHLKINDEDFGEYLSARIENNFSVIFKTEINNRLSSIDEKSSMLQLINALKGN